MRTEAERKQANAEKSRRYRERHPGRALASVLRWQQANPEMASAAWRRYGLSKEAYDWLLVYQGGGCAVCRTVEPGDRRLSVFHVDHDHEHCETCRVEGRSCRDEAAVRGLLCQGCNIGSKLTDSAILLRMKADYLDEFTLNGSPLLRRQR